ncbi:MAG: hypothetical protein ACYCVD_05930 [Desulfitobacteriaceae bacterium]
MENMSGEEFLNLMAGMHGDRLGIAQRRCTLAKRLDLNLKQRIASGTTAYV